MSTAPRLVDVDAVRATAAPVVLIIDIGSSSIRASCWAARGHCEDDRVAPPQAEVDAPQIEWELVQGSLQQLASDDLMDAQGDCAMLAIATAVETVLSRALAFVRASDIGARLVGVGFSTFVMNLLGVDAQGAPATPVYTYAGRMPSTAMYARQLREELAAQGRLNEFHDRTGTVIHPAYAPAVFLRLHHEESERVNRVAKWQSITAYLLSQWVETDGTCVPMSYTEASWTGLFDFRRADWDWELLERVHMDKSKMPPLRDSSAALRGLRAPYAEKWPELAHVPFFLGIGDGAAANIGSKCVDASRVAVTIGTSAALRVVLKDETMKEHQVPNGLWCYRITPDRILLGGALNDGGSVFQFFQRLLNVSLEELDRSLLELPANQHHLSVLPFLSGERSPGWHDEATCTISGINRWTKPLDLLQAGLESVAMRLASVFGLLAGYANTDALIVGSGTGLTASMAWRQILANCIGRDLVIEQGVVEATSRGVAVLLGTYLGLHALDESQHLDEKDLVHARPSVGDHEVYVGALQTQEALYHTLYGQV